jgi:hypothetical protein
MNSIVRIFIINYITAGPGGVEPLLHLRDKQAAYPDAHDPINGYSMKLDVTVRNRTYIISDNPHRVNRVKMVR